MRDVYLSLYSVPHGDRSGLLAFLVLAGSEDEAHYLSEEFVDHVNTVSDAASDLETAALSQDALFEMRAKICFLTEADEIALLSKALAKTNPHLGSALSLHIGGVFTVRVAPDQGFPVETAEVLRKRMVKHHTLASITVPFA